jgi:hypothetical protein
MFVAAVGGHDGIAGIASGRDGALGGGAEIVVPSRLLGYCSSEIGVVTHPAEIDF